MDDITNLDLYKLIGATPSASVSEIKKAYRKKALSCHPDKNPDNPRAAELFHELSKALEILTDASARAAYDKVIEARQQAKARHNELSAKRKKLKEDLEAREEAYMRSLHTPTNVKADEQKLQAEIERLRKEGSKQVEEEVAFVKQKIYEQLYQTKDQSERDPEHYRIKIRWKVEHNDPTNGGYDYDTLHRMLSKYGDIEALVLSESKKGRALIEFQDKNAAKMAAQIELGLADNPLILKPMWQTMTSANQTSENIYHSRSDAEVKSRLFPIHDPSGSSKSCAFANFSSAPNIFAQQNKVSDVEFETSVLNNLRRAEERKRLIEELKTEEND